MVLIQRLRQIYTSRRLRIPTGCQATNCDCPQILRTETRITSHTHVTWKTNVLFHKQNFNIFIRERSKRSKTFQEEGSRYLKYLSQENPKTIQYSSAVFNCNRFGPYQGRNRETRNSLVPALRERNGKCVETKA